MNKKVMFLPLGIFCVAVLANCNNKKTLTIWVDSKIVETTKTEVNRFKTNNPDFKYNVRIDTVSEQDAASNMITDVESGADLFVYAQDQFTRLIAAGALSAIPNSSEDEMTVSGLEEEVKNEHVEGAIAAVTHKGENDKRKHIYSYPVTSDNGYFLFYNKKYFTGAYEKKYETVEGILETCEKCSTSDSRKRFGVNVDKGWWYSAGFFLSHKIVDGKVSDEPMCHSDWTTSSSGKFIAKDDDFSKNGVFACKIMAKIFQSDYYLDTHNADDMKEDSGVIALVDGNWDYESAKKIVGEDNLGVAKLPTFTVTDDDDTNKSTYQMGSFSGYKLMGVKPHSDANESYWCAKLAKYLTDKECQLDRFESVGWGPSNKEALTDEKVKGAASLIALAEQNKYAVPQGCYPNDWWNYGEDRVSGQLKNDKKYKSGITTAQAKELLEGYDKQIATLVEEE